MLSVTQYYLLLSVFSQLLIHPFTYRHMQDVNNIYDKDGYNIYDIYSSKQCCFDCPYNTTKYYMIDELTNSCAETCLEPSWYELFRIFEPKLLYDNTTTYPCYLASFPKYEYRLVHGIWPMQIEMDVYSRGDANISSCENRCRVDYSNINYLKYSCFCDDMCTRNNDCCDDFESICKASCKNMCGQFPGLCYCDSSCIENDDCCDDYYYECQ